LLDEATASVDPDTDKLIQVQIKQNYKRCTVITIAHRLKTIINSKYICVMEMGKVAEFDTP